MMTKEALGTILVAVAACSPALGGEHMHKDRISPPWIRRLEPVGGWHPDDGGLLHWWNPHCFPPLCGPDDYCRKPITNMCRPLPQVLPPFVTGDHPPH